MSSRDDEFDDAFNAKSEQHGSGEEYSDENDAADGDDYAEEPRNIEASEGNMSGDDQLDEDTAPENVGDTAENTGSDRSDELADSVDEVSGGDDTELRDFVLDMSDDSEDEASDAGQDEFSDVDLEARATSNDVVPDGIGEQVPLFDEIHDSVNHAIDVIGSDTPITADHANEEADGHRSASNEVTGGEDSLRNELRSPFSASWADNEDWDPAEEIRKGHQDTASIVARQELERKGSNDAQDGMHETNGPVQEETPDSLDDPFADFDSVLPLTVGDEEAGQDEVRSHFSDSSSDSEGWNTDDINDATGPTVARMKLKREATEDDDTLIAPEESYTAGTDPASEEEPYRIDESKPWLRRAHLNGSLLPMAAYGDDDLYRRDAEFYHTGQCDISRQAPRHAKYDDGRFVPLSEGKRSTLSEDGKMQRVRSILHETRIERDQATYDRDIMRGEIEATDAELREAREEIGMLKHAVDTRQESLETLRETSDNKLEKFRESVVAWKARSDQWQAAFESQRPLADAERERRAMMEAGIEFSQEYVEIQIQSPTLVDHDHANMMDSADTQTSPAEIPSRKTTEKTQLTNAATQTDRDAPDANDLLTLTKERNDLVQDNQKLFDQVKRLAALLEENKEWLEARNFTLKEPIDEAERSTNAQPRPAIEVSRASVDSDTPRSDHVYFEADLPSDPFMLNWPQHWIERDEEMRKSASWIKARDQVAAELDAWEKQFWARANATIAIYG